MGGRADGLTVKPSGRLGAFVVRYTGYRLTGFQPGVHLGLGTTTLPLIISLADAPVAVARRPTLRPAHFTALIAGLRTHATEVRHDGSLFGIQVDLRPAAARALFGLPPAELYAQELDLGDVMGSEAGELLGRLREARDWTARFAVLDDMFTRLLDRRDLAAEPAVEHAWRLLTQGPPTRVSAVADQVFWSRRQLAAKFTAEYGLGPKEAARVSRFSRAVALLRADPTRSLADLAHRCAFSDQAHFTREWRSFTGLSPTRWLRDEEFPFVQDLAPPATAASKA
jgi:AraC-like DNA-binding protein